MAVDRQGNTIATGQVYLLAGTVRRIDGDTVLIVLGERGEMAVRVKASDVVTVDASVAGGGGGGSVAWGAITGTLASQGDLNSALVAKAPIASPTFTGAAIFGTAGSLSSGTLPEHFLRFADLAGTAEIAGIALLLADKADTTAVLAALALKADDLVFDATHDGLVPAPGTPTGRILDDSSSWVSIPVPVPPDGSVTTPKLADGAVTVPKALAAIRRVSALRL